MPANYNPIFSRIGVIGSNIAQTTGVTRSDGVGNTGSNMKKVFTSDVNNGSYVQKIRLTPYATAANTAMAATVIRVYYSTETANNATTTVDNTHLLAEVLTTTQSASNATTQVYNIEVPLGFAMPANTAILVSTHLNPAANTNWSCVVFGGHY